MNIVSLIIITMSWGLDRPWGQAQLLPNTPMLRQGAVSAVIRACLGLPRPVKHQDSEMPQACVLGEERDVNVLEQAPAPGHVSMWNPGGWKAGRVS